MVDLFENITYITFPFGNGERTLRTGKEIKRMQAIRDYNGALVALQTIGHEGQIMETVSLNCVPCIITHTPLPLDR